MRITMPRQPELRIGSERVLDVIEIVRAGSYSGVAIVTGGRSVRGKAIWTTLTETLLDYGVAFLDFTVRGEPSPEVVDRFRDELLRDVPDCDLVVAIGGGSVIDAGKALAALLGMDRASDTRLTSAQSIGDFLEGVGTLQPTGETLPLIAVPTTAGTGSEATKNAVLSSVGTEGFKKSLRHDNFIPSIAIIDPTLHIGCPDSVTRASGLDAITQLIEVYLSTQANTMSDTLALEGLEHAGRAFPRLMSGTDTEETRRDMAIAAYFSGVGLAAVGLGIVHGIASPLGALLPIPHGVVCGTTLAPSIRYTVDALENSGTEVLHRYATAARALGIGGSADDRLAVEELIEALTAWAKPLPRFREYGMTEENLHSLATVVNGKNHPISLPEEIVVAILREAM